VTKAADNEAFVREYQRRNGLTTDGWAGEKTWASLGVEEYEFDEAAFFAKLRAEFGSLSQQMVDGCKTLIAALSDWPVSWIAYALATAKHETADTMQPIKERGGEAYFKRMYDIMGERPAKARELGNVKPGDGARYAGRGYVQLTGRANYAQYGLADNPDDAMKPEIAARVLKDGMEKGRFTGKSLKDYLPGDYIGARRIVNGTDRAQMIADYAVKFEKALKAGGFK
jgi:hypothetical protein